MDTNFKILLNDIKTLKYNIKDPEQHKDIEKNQILLFNKRNELISLFGGLDLEQRLTEVSTHALDVFPKTLINHSIEIKHGDDPEISFDLQYQPYLLIDDLTDTANQTIMLNNLYLIFAQSDRDRRVYPEKRSAAESSESLITSLKRTPLNSLTLLHSILRNAYSVHGTDKEILVNAEKQSFDGAFYISDQSDYAINLSGDITIKITFNDTKLSNNIEDSLKYLMLQDSRRRMKNLFRNITVSFDINGTYFKHLEDRTKSVKFNIYHKINIRPMHSKMLKAVYSYTSTGNETKYKNIIINKALSGEQEFTYSELDIMIFLFKSILYKEPNLDVPSLQYVETIPKSADTSIGFDYYSQYNMAYGRLWFGNYEAEILINYDNPCNMSMKNSISHKLFLNAQRQLPFHITTDNVSYIKKLYVSRFNEQHDMYIEYPSEYGIPDDYYASLSMMYMERKLHLNQMTPDERNDFLVVFKTMEPWLDTCTHFHHLRLMIQKFTEDTMNYIAEVELNNHIDFLREINRDIPLSIYDTRTQKLLDSDWETPELLEKHPNILKNYRIHTLIEHYRHKYNFLYLRPFISAVCGKKEKGLFRAYLRRFANAQKIWSLKWKHQVDGLYDDPRQFQNIFERNMNSIMIYNLVPIQEPTVSLRFWYRDFAHNAVIDFLDINDLKNEDGHLIRFHEEIVAYALIKHTFINDKVSYRDIAPYACSIVNSLIYKNPYISISFFMVCLFKLNKMMQTYTNKNRSIVGVFQDEKLMNKILSSIFLEIGVDFLFGGKMISYIAPEYDNFSDTIEKYRSKQAIVTPKMHILNQRLIEYDKYVAMNNVLEFNTWTTDKRKFNRPGVLLKPPTIKEHANRHQDITIASGPITINPCCFLTLDEEIVIFAYYEGKKRKQIDKLKIIKWDDNKEQPGNVLYGYYHFTSNDLNDINVSNSQRWAPNIQVIQNQINERFKTTKNATKAVLDKLKPITQFIYDYYNKNPGYTKWHITFLINMLYDFFVYNYNNGEEKTFRSRVNFLTQNESEIMNNIKEQVILFLDILQGKKWYSSKCSEFTDNEEWVFDSSPQVRLCQSGAYSAWSRIDEVFGEIQTKHNIPVSGLQLEYSYWFKRFPQLTIFLNPMITKTQHDNFCEELAEFMRQQVNDVFLPGLIRNIVEPTPEDMDKYVKEAVSKFGDMLFNYNMHVPAYTAFRDKYKPDFMKSATHYNMAYTQAHM